MANLDDVLLEAGHANAWQKVDDNSAFGAERPFMLDDFPVLDKKLFEIKIRSDPVLNPEKTYLPAPPSSPVLNDADCMVELDDDSSFGAAHPIDEFDCFRANPKIRNIMHGGIRGTGGPRSKKVYDPKKKHWGRPGPRQKYQPEPTTKQEMGVPVDAEIETFVCHQIATHEQGRLMPCGHNVKWFDPVWGTRHHKCGACGTRVTVLSKGEWGSASMGLPSDYE
jgi:hypothetical protein